MPKFTYDDFSKIEKSSTKPSEIENCISNLMVTSLDTRARVEAVNRETGEYRIVLQGTLNIDKHSQPKGNR